MTKILYKTDRCQDLCGEEAKTQAQSSTGIIIFIKKLYPAGENIQAQQGKTQLGTNNLA